MTFKIKMVKIADVPTPKYAHEGDSGVDLYAAESCTLQHLERRAVKTGLKLEIPRGYEGQVRPKSGLALSYGLSHANCVGTIDSCYRGEIRVPLINLGKEPYIVEKGKKIGQLVFAKVEEAEFEEVKELENTTRAEDGFGSTGL
ncbi:dUTP diphosphatase [Candidatus Woesearchaeota archaeon]|nr:dUTP diphosphatase [Candidatus Woesearchaeota archaeon]